MFISSKKKKNRILIWIYLKAVCRKWDVAVQFTMEIKKIFDVEWTA